MEVHHTIDRAQHELVVETAVTFIDGTTKELVQAIAKKCRLVLVEPEQWTLTPDGMLRASYVPEVSARVTKSQKRPMTVIEAQRRFETRRGVVQMTFGMLLTMTGLAVLWLVQ